MPTTYSTRAQLPSPALNDRNWHTPLIALRDDLDAVNAIGELAVILTEVPSTSLNVAVTAGYYRRASGVLASYAGTASQAITTATTKYLYLTDGGTLTVGSAWPTAGYYVPLAVVVAGATTITSITDARNGAGSVSAAATSGTATLAAGTVTVTTAAVAAGSKILYSRQATGGTPGHLSIGTITAGTSFVINSSSGSDTSDVYWRIAE